MHQLDQLFFVDQQNFGENMERNIVHTHKVKD